MDESENAPGHYKREEFLIWVTLLAKHQLLINRDAQLTEALINQFILYFSTKDSHHLSRHIICHIPFPPWSLRPPTLYNEWSLPSQSPSSHQSFSGSRQTWLSQSKYLCTLYFSTAIHMVSIQSLLIHFFFLRFDFISFWLRWVFVAVHGLSLVAASGGCSSLRCAGFSLRWLLLLRSTGSRWVGFSTVACGLRSCGSRALERRLSSCGAWAYLWELKSRVGLSLSQGASSTRWWYTETHFFLNHSWSRINV